jgi:hypothetical protein
MISIAPFHRAAKSFTNGSTSSIVIGCALLVPAAASSPVIINHVSTQPTLYQQKHSILLTEKCLLAKKNNSHTFSPFSPENRPGIGKTKRKQTDLHESSQIESAA